MNKYSHSYPRNPQHPVDNPSYPPQSVDKRLWPVDNLCVLSYCTPSLLALFTPYPYIPRLMALWGLVDPLIGWSPSTDDPL